MNTVGYIIEVLISSGLFLALFRWLLAGKVRYRICRAYIVGTMLLAAVIPLLDVPMYSPAPVPAAVERALVLVPEAMPESGIVPGEGAADEIPAAPTATDAIVLKILAAAYILISASSIALIVFNTIKIRRLRREARLTRIEDWTLAESEKIQIPFSDGIHGLQLQFLRAPDDSLTRGQPRPAPAFIREASPIRPAQYPVVQPFPVDSRKRPEGSAGMGGRPRRP